MSYNYLNSDTAVKIINIAEVLLVKNTIQYKTHTHRHTFIYPSLFIESVYCLNIVYLINYSRKLSNFLAVCIWNSTFASFAAGLVFECFGILNVIFSIVFYFISCTLLSFPQLNLLINWLKESEKYYKTWTVLKWKWNKA